MRGSYPRPSGSANFSRILKPERRKILYVIWSLGVGGAERVVELLCLNLDRERFEPVVACLGDAGALAPPLEAAGIRVIPLHKARGADLRVIRRLVRLIRRERIDLVHGHLWGGNLWGRISARLCGVPVVVTEHNVDVWKTTLHFAIDRVLIRVTQRLIAVSEAVRDFYAGKGLSAARIVVIPNGIDTARFPASERSSLYTELGWGNEVPVMVAIGRLAPQKHHERFIELMARLLQDCPAARGLIIGEGERHDALRDELRTRGLEGRVVLTGVRSDIPALLAGARALVLTSSREGLPMVMLEAMASAVPVLSTDVGGVGEVIVPEATGWLVAEENWLELARPLLRLATDPELAARVGGEAQARVRECWSVESMLRAHQELYDTVLDP